MIYIIGYTLYKHVTKDVNSYILACIVNVAGKCCSDENLCSSGRRDPRGPLYISIQGYISNQYPVEYKVNHAPLYIMCSNGRQDIRGPLYISIQRYISNQYPVGCKVSHTL